MTDEHESQSPDQTRRLPPSESETAGPGPSGGGPVPWSGRAEVRPPAAPVDRDGTGYWIDQAEPGDRRWWTPILVGIVALVLLGMLAVGAWLVLRSREVTPPTTTPSTSPATASGTQPASPSVSPSPVLPTPTPSLATGAARVPLPPLAGLPQAGAQALLDQLGLGYRLRFEPSDRPAGTIVRTDPPAGTLVEPGDEITLVIAEELTPPSGPPPTAPPATG